MSASPADLPFLQSLYQQDTLYLVPEAQPLAGQPVPATVATVELPPAQTAESQESLGKIPETYVQIEEPAAVDTAPASVPDKIIWMGEAVKGTYLLFQVTDPIFRTLPEHAFLKKVLAAVGLASLDVKFGNLSEQKTHNVKEIARAQQARHILVFGAHLPIENLLKLEPYRMYKLDETRFVRVDSLSDIEQSTELKKKLWDVLQKIFLQ